MSLCPHFLPEYFCKVHEVLVAFHPQISQTPIHEISSRLVARNVITENEYYDILLVNTNCLKSEKLINIISKRLPGFECFVLILMEENYQSWLSEELFNAYIRHVVEHIKRLKSSKKCTCPSSASESEWNLFATVKNKLANAAEAVDHCLYNVGTSMGFMDQTIFPTKNFLEPINKRLPFLVRGGMSSETNIQKILDHPKNECTVISPIENMLEPSITVVNICKVEEVENLDCAINANNNDVQILEENERTSTHDDIGDGDDNVDLIMVSAQELSKNSARIHGWTARSSEDFNPDSKSNSRTHQGNWSPCNDLEWDNYDMVTNSLIQSQKYTSSAPSEKPIALDICQQSLSSPSTKQLQRKFGKNESQKNPTSPDVRFNRLTSKRGARTPAALNTTSRPRISPSDYATVQKSIEWCNKTYK